MVVTPILQETIALTHYVELADSEGRLVLLPRATVDTLLATGFGTVVLTISLNSEPPAQWLTVSDAAKLHVDDVDGLTKQAAAVRVSRACTAGKITCEGTGTRRRIEPTSFAAWRLTERERNLERD